MRIMLIESGGFVGVPLRYEVDVAALDAPVLAALERALATAAAEPPAPVTSAGGGCIRVEHDDGRVSELALSYAAPNLELADLAERLHAVAKLVRER